MEISMFCENRDYLRVKAKVPVRYRFLSNTVRHPVLGETLQGETRDLSGGGLLLKGTIPEESWIPELLMERITIGVSIYLQDVHEPVRALARVAWLNTGSENDLDSCRIGLKFVEITREAQDRLFRYILEDLLP
jgi:c-di-GMP-binding flagellar brake protein YcgR